MIQLYLLYQFRQITKITNPCIFLLAEHLQRCQAKLDVLLEQQVDLSAAIDQLLEDIAAGRIYMKVYHQMKMYNDPSTNPILYKK